MSLPRGRGIGGGQVLYEDWVIFAFLRTTFHSRLDAEGLEETHGSRACSDLLNPVHECLMATVMFSSEPFYSARYIARFLAILTLLGRTIVYFSPFLRILCKAL